jgi:hypothetical protein
MSTIREIIPPVGLLATIGVAAFMVVQLHGQAPAVTGDFTNAAAAEVRNAQGQVLLQGQFMLVDEEDDDVERKATLTQTGIDADAAGEAEVEYAKATPVTQEIEFSVRNLEPGAVVTFVIDGTDVATATADRQGRAEVELDVRISAS